MTKKTIGVVDLKNSKEDSSKAVSFNFMEPASSSGFKRSRTGIEVNVEHPGPQLAHESRRSRSKKKKRVKSPDSIKDSKSSKKEKKSQKSPGLRDGSSSSYELRRLKKKKKRKGSAKERSDSRENRSSQEHHRGTMSANGPRNVNKEEAAQDYAFSDDKNKPQFGVDHIDFSKMS